MLQLSLFRDLKAGPHVLGHVVHTRQILQV